MSKAFSSVCYLLPALLLASFAAAAQGEYNNWYFGQRAGLAFSATASAPQPLLNGAMTAPRACATLSDAAGNLLIYSDGDRIWNAQHQVLSLPGGAAGLGGSVSIAQGCAVARVGAVGYVFTLRPPTAGAGFSPIPNRLWATAVQLDASGPRVTAANLPVVADTVLQRLGETDLDPYQTIIRHANGRDLWLISHLVRQHIFLASLIEATGQWPVARTVASRMTRTIVDASGYSFSNMSASPDGHHLLFQNQLIDFDAATGQLTNMVRLQHPAPTIPSAFTQPYPLSGAFSPNGNYVYLSGLYLTNGSSNGGNAVQVTQFDLNVGTPAAVAASGIEVYNVGNGQVAGILPSAMQRGPNGLIYAAVEGATALDVIQAPNARGRACQYTPGHQPLQGRTSGSALPPQPNDVGLIVLVSGGGGTGGTGTGGAGTGGTGTGGGTTGGGGTGGTSSNPNPAPLPLTAEALPNIITPNGDAVNEYFALPTAQLAGWSLTIYNRWGRQVFQQARYDSRWNAAGLADGVYFYHLSNAASGQRFKGWVEVVR